MLENSIDNKKIITVNDIQIVDLTESCFNEKKINNDIVVSLKRVPYNMIMRMDLVSLAQYDTEEYTDILLKYNDISNPFTLNYDDILYLPTLENIKSNINKEITNEKSNVAELVRNYHKYVDKNKLPKTIGSEKNELKIEKQPTEANMSEEDYSPIVVRNGRMYFNNNSNVECSTNGISSSDFLIQKIENIL